jgi:SAM-dependent methyltransferase
MRAIPALIQGQLKLPPTVRALDVGCGAGCDVEFFSHIYRYVVGVDFYEHERWKIIGAEKNNVEFHCTAFLDYEENSTFDLVLDNGCFHHQHPQEQAPYLIKISEVTTPGGWFVMSTFKSFDPREAVDVNGRIHRWFSDDELTELINDAGFKISQQIDIYRPIKKDFYRLVFCQV